MRGGANFCPIIPYSSTLLTMPVAFIYLSPFTILYGTAIPPLSLRGSNAIVAISSEQLILEIATPVCALVRNDRGSRQPPTIILQITMLLFVKGRRLYFAFGLIQFCKLKIGVDT